MSTPRISLASNSPIEGLKQDNVQSFPEGTTQLNAINARIGQNLRLLMDNQARSVHSSTAQQSRSSRQGWIAKSNIPTADSGSYAPLDAYSAQHDQSDLKQWSDLASSDQGISLERPLAAMQILAGKSNSSGQKPSPEQIDAALEFINNNPSLTTALQNKGVFKDDGSVDKGKIGDFLREVETNLSLADKNIKAYQKKNPSADRNSLNAVRSAALLQAYEPIAGESAGHKSNGKDNSYSGGKNGGGFTTRQQIGELQNNDGFSSSLKAAAQAWSTKGAFDAIDRSGDDKAITKASDTFTANNVSHFITDDAPSSKSTGEDFLWNASIKNIIGDNDISNLNQDIFSHPQNYSPQQKAAVMVKLMETLVNVQAGGDDDLRDVNETVAALQKDIATLANDPDTAAYLSKTVPPEMQNLNANFERSGGAPELTNTTSSKEPDDEGRNDQTSFHDIVGIAKSATGKIKNARSLAENAKTATEQLAKLTGRTASEFAEHAASRAIGTAARTAARVGMAGLTATMEGLAVSGPAGWVVDAVLAIPDIVLGIMWIVDEIQKARHRSAFADNVNPTLKQFGIPLPK
jgi:Type III secretion system translocator protein, HrpF